MVRELVNAVVMILISCTVVTLLTFIARSAWVGARHAVEPPTQAQRKPALRGDNWMALADATREPRHERLVTRAELAEIEASWEQPVADVERRQT